MDMFMTDNCIRISKYRTSADARACSHKNRTTHPRTGRNETDRKRPLQRGACVSGGGLIRVRPKTNTRKRKNTHSSAVSE